MKIVFSALELVGPDYRSFVTVMTCTFYTFGIMGLAVVTYIVPNWVEMSLYTSLPFLLYFFYLLVMPESPRWLLAQEKFEEALNILEVMARVNGKKLPNNFRLKLHERAEADKLRTKENAKTLNSFDLCRSILFGKNYSVKKIHLKFVLVIKDTKYALENAADHIELVCQRNCLSWSELLWSIAGYR